ncbi:hypothetical protein GIB67_001590, partial [Kingdonia uniflora]
KVYAERRRKTRASSLSLKAKSDLSLSLSLSTPYYKPPRSNEAQKQRITEKMSALFNFHSFLTVVLFVICTCTYIKMLFPKILQEKTGFLGFFWKAARIGERLSPWVAMGCFIMGVSILVF